MATVVTSLLDEVDEILAKENGTFPPGLAKRWHKALAFFSLGPPSLNQGYYYYGLLDCVSQLAAVSEPQMLGQGLLKRVVDLIFDSVVPEFRWKAVSTPGFRGKACIGRYLSVPTNISPRSKSFCHVNSLARNSIGC